MKAKEELDRSNFAVLGVCILPYDCGFFSMPCFKNLFAASISFDAVAGGRFMGGALWLFLLVLLPLALS